MRPTVEFEDASAEQLLHARYRDGAVPAGPWNEVIATILAHRSVRAFLRDPLPEGTLERLVAAAQSASTSSNLQTWSVIAVEHPERKARLAELGAGQQHIEVCPLYLVWCVDHSRLYLAASERQIVLGGLDYLKPFVVGVVDAALAAQNAGIAAESARSRLRLYRGDAQPPRTGRGGAGPAASRYGAVRDVHRLSRSGQTGRHQAASAAIFRPAPRGIQCGGALCSLCRLDTRLRAFQREQGDEGDTVDRAGDQPREIRSIAAWARPHTSSDRSAGISDQVGDMPMPVPWYDDLPYPVHR